MATGGGMRRNDLERASMVPKASLARVVANLEARNIVNVDRARNVHYIQVTDWFMGL